MKDEITKAIGAHGMWKMRLKRILETGVAEIDPVKAASDNQCEFGKWLHGQTLPADVKSSAQYKTIKILHANFHQCAGKITRLALSGEKDEANRAMSTEFDDVSRSLVAEMMQWKKAA